jgi:predicted transcriptional regulator
VQPEIHTLLDRLKEHPALRGKFQTKSHVAWMLMHLGAAAVYRYLQDDWAEQDDIVDSITYRLSAVQAEQSRIEEREAVMTVVSIQKQNILSYLKWETPEGKYKAWKALKGAFDMREHAPSMASYDNQMKGNTVLSINPELAPVERYYDRMLRGLTEEVYIELTQEYYDEMDNERAGR